MVRRLSVGRSVIISKIGKLHCNAMVYIIFSTYVVHSFYFKVVVNVIINFSKTGLQLF